MIQKRPISTISIRCLLSIYLVGRRMMYVVRVCAIGCTRDRQSMSEDDLERDLWVLVSMYCLFSSIKTTREIPIGTEISAQSFLGICENYLLLFRKRVGDGWGV